jgi:two-component system chemotaxis response regulator CheY
MTFLVVDDSQRFRASVSRYLRSGFPDHPTILEASDGEAAAKLYGEVHPDWVLMDIAMEPVDGLSGSRAILQADPNAKIIILTNYDEPAYREAAKSAGILAFVLKEHLTDLLPILSSQSVRGSA